jgi:UMF1 family MFS transporter
MPELNTTTLSTPIPVAKGNKKVIQGWVMYDWANSVYQLTIGSAIFPVYYNTMTQNGGQFTVTFFGAKVINTVLYSWAIASAFLLLALLSPLLSAIADYTGRRKSFMKAFTWIGALGCGMMFFFNRNTIELGVISLSLATFGYAGSIVFYNSFLPVIAEPQDHDRISARGYSMGYLGGVILLLFNLMMILKPGWFGIPADSSLPARISFLTVCVWWLSFSQITFRRLPKFTYRKQEVKGHIFIYGYKELQSVFRQVKRSRTLTTYLAGYFFFMMGLLTVMYMAATYGVKEMGLKDDVLIPIVLVINLVGMFGAWFFARLSGKVGNLPALIVSLVAWTFICLGAYFITNVAQFVTVAFFIGIVMGGTQSLARSTYSKMLPESTTDHTSFFSFFDVMEKLAMAGGMFSFGFMEALTGNMRASVLAIGIFFLVGLGFILAMPKSGLNKA